MNGVSSSKTELEDRVKKLQRKLIVVQKDRDHYRTINDMYESDMTRVGGMRLFRLFEKSVRNILFPF